MNPDKDNKDNNNKNSFKPKKSLIYYSIAMIVIIMLVNMFVVPMIMNQSIEEVSYDKFLQHLDANQIDEVQIDDNQIAYTLKNDTDEITYITGTVYDPTLITRLDDSNVTFSQVIPDEMSPLMTFFFSWVIPILFFVVIWQFFFRNMQQRMGGSGGLFNMGKSNAKLYVAEKTKKTFADVAGVDEAKESLYELVDFLNNPEKYKKIGAKLPKGALLVGPPGTGKTLLAQAIAGEAGVPFFSISGSEFVEMFVGMGAARVRDLFKQAQEKAPCIIFIDEIDAIGKHRDSAGFSSNDEREQTLNQLLAEMDGFDSSAGVVILAATNRPETLDKALLRPGRFDRRIPVDLPDLNGREAILKVHAKNIIIDDNIDYKPIAKATSGASGADLANIINEAALLAVKASRNRVTQKDLEDAVENVIAGHQRKNAVMTDREKQLIAYHEVGHAIVAANMKDAAPVHKITIIPRTSGALGFTMQLEEQDKVLMSKEDLINRITTLFGGRAAEESVFDTITTGAANDIEQATKLARTMVTRWGMSDEFDMMALETVTNPYLSQDAAFGCSSDTSSKVDSEVLHIIKECHSRAIQILKENEEKHHEIAKYLLTKETMTGEEFMEMLGKADNESEESEIQ